MRIKINKLDILFSRYVRLKAKNHCEYCGKYKEFSQLQNAHCFGRRKQSVRYDERNTAALCFTCHRLIDENHEAKREFFMKRLGEKQYKALMVEAETPRKNDKVMIELQLKEMLNGLSIGD